MSGVKQAKVMATTFREIVADTAFRVGVRDAVAGRPFPADVEHRLRIVGGNIWNYERGRLFAAAGFRLGRSVEQDFIAAWQNGAVI